MFAVYSWAFSVRIHRRGVDNAGRPRLSECEVQIQERPAQRIHKTEDLCDSDEKHSLFSAIKRKNGVEYLPRIMIINIGSVLEFGGG